MAEVVEEDGGLQNPMVIAQMGVDVVQDIVRRVTELLVHIKRSPGSPNVLSDQRSALQAMFNEVSANFNRLRKFQNALEARTSGLPSVSVNDVLKPVESIVGDNTSGAKTATEGETESKKRPEAAGWLIADRETLLQQIDARNRQLRTAIQQLRELLTTIDTVLPMNVSE